MPNWCSGTLTITGTKEELQKFKEHAFTKNKYKEDNSDKNEVLDTEKFVPFPKKYYEIVTIKKKMEEMTDGDKANQEMLQVLEDTENPFKPFENEYDWCCANYGTKWGICHAEIFEETDKKLTYTFDTAWSPCNPVIHAMTRMFPKLKFNYKFYEGGMGFSGQLVIKNNIASVDKYNAITRRMPRR